MKYSIEIKSQKNYKYKEIFLVTIGIISALLIQNFRLWLSLVIVVIIFLTIIFIPIKKMLNKNVIDDDILDSGVVIESSKNFTIKNKDGWELAFNKLSKLGFENYYRYWDNINGKTTNLFQIKNFNQIYTESSESINVFTDFIEQENDCVILQKLNIQNYKLESSILIIQNEEIILDEKIGPFKLSRVSKNVIEGINGTRKIEIRLIDNESQ